MAGRPRQFDRQAALDTAVEHFWRRGYEQTTVASLTQAMGITAPSLYAAFGDKDSLFAEATRCYADQIETGLSGALDKPTLAEALTELMRATAAWHTDPGSPRGCLVISEPRLAEHRAELAALIQARIARGRDDGEVAAGTDPAVVADYIMAVLAGMSARARDGGSAEEVGAIAEFALRALPLRALAADA